MMSGDKIKPKRLADEAFSTISGWIMASRFLSGAHLDEGGLCATLGVSRTPVREALFRLEAHGFVTSTPNRGFFVSVPDKDIVGNLYPVVAVLEALAIKTSPRFGDKQIARLKLINRDLGAAKGSNSLLFQLDLDFHETLVNSCPNPRLLGLIETLKAQTRRYDGGYRRGLANRKSAHADHQKIISALEAGENPRAAGLVEAHWLGGIKTVTDWIANQPKTEKAHAGVLS